MHLGSVKTTMVLYWALRPVLLPPDIGHFSALGRTGQQRFGAVFSPLCKNSCDTVILPKDPLEIISPLLSCYG